MPCSRSAVVIRPAICRAPAASKWVWSLLKNAPTALLAFVVGAGGELGGEAGGVLGPL